jgi:hypothetical protein
VTLNASTHGAPDPPADVAHNPWRDARSGIRYGSRAAAAPRAATRRTAPSIAAAVPVELPPTSMSAAARRASR